MAKEKEISAPAFQWICSKEGVPEVYANVIAASWTLTDVRFRIGQVVPNPNADDPKNPFVTEERAAVTIAWAQAKWLRDNLINLIASYEKVNGEIKPITLPPSE
jgi:hypothetical protein